MMLANVLVPLTTAVRSDRRAPKVSRRRTCRVTTGALFAQGNSYFGNHGTKNGDDFVDSYAWAREDQRRSLTHQNPTKFDDNLVIHAHTKSEFGGHGSVSIDGWTKDDQRLSLRNEAIRKNVSDAMGRGSNKNVCERFNR